MSLKLTKVKRTSKTVNLLRLKILILESFIEIKTHKICLDKMYQDIWFA